MTLNELTYSIIDQIVPRLRTVDAVSPQLVKDNIHNVRAMLLKQRMSKNKSIDSDNIQDLGCVDVELVDKAECCDINIGCKFLRTKEPLPITLGMSGKPLITRVASVDKLEKPFTVIQYERAPFVGLNRFTKNQIWAFLMNSKNHLYLQMTPANLTGQMIEKINIQGVFEDPTEAAKFSDCEGQPCYTDDSEYPIEAWMIPTLQDIVIQRVGLVLPDTRKKPVDEEKSE